MVFDHIEKLKREFTDKYVVVDNVRPELRRFEGQTGMIKTVNMNGRALVEFDGFDNIGWFDISLDFLKVVDKPIVKEEPKKKAPAKKAAAKPAAKAAAAPAAKPAGGAMSVADMLAAARGEKGGAAPAAKKAEPKAAPAASAKKDPGKMSVADMLAAARGEKSGAAAPAAAPEPVAEPEPAAEAAVEPEVAAAPPAGDLPKDTAGIIAYCQQRDGG